MSNFTVTINYDGHKFIVEGTATPYRPARTNCSNDDACPAEGGIEEYTKVHLLDVKGVKIELPDFLQEELELHFESNDDVDQRVDEALKDCAEAGKADREERE
jgi:hypothetical protein